MNGQRYSLKKILWISFLALVLLGLGLSGGIVLDRQVLSRFDPPASIPPAAESDFQLMAEAWNVIQQNYVDRAAVQPRPLTYGAIGGMVSALGDTGHSRFLSPEMVKEEHDFTQGQYEGIGAEVQMKDGHAVIVAPMDGSPAQQAGLRSGDVILAVDGQNVTGLSLDQIVKRILGPAGSSVTLTVLDPKSGETRDLTLTRAHITVHNVNWHQLPGTTVAHLRVASFSQGVTDDLKKSLREIQQEGMTGLVLDLRDDPGGLLDEAIGVASEFLSSGNVLLEKDAKGQVKQIEVRPGGAATEIPMVVLINAGTASAAEIVAGALQDAHRADLVGETTFGTGTVLGEFGLSDGSALLLAIQEWLTPGGRVIWHQGIVPDVEVPLSAGVTPLFPNAEQDLTSAQLQAGDDAQLARALELLTQSTKR